jgi:hypothetical protein
MKKDFICRLMVSICSRVLTPSARFVICCIAFFSITTPLFGQFPIFNCYQLQQLCNNGSAYHCQRHAAFCSFGSYCACMDNLGQYSGAPFWCSQFPIPMEIYPMVPDEYKYVSYPVHTLDNEGIDNLCNLLGYPGPCRGIAYNTTDITYSIWVNAGKWVFTLNQVRLWGNWGVKTWDPPWFELWDVPNALMEEITLENYQEIVDDLTPNSLNYYGQPNLSNYYTYWIEERHELRHISRFFNSYYLPYMMQFRTWLEQDHMIPFSCDQWSRSPDGADWTMIFRGEGIMNTFTDTFANAAIDYAVIDDQGEPTAYQLSNALYNWLAGNIEGRFNP